MPYIIAIDPDTHHVGLAAHDRRDAWRVQTLHAPVRRIEPWLHRIELLVPRILSFVESYLPQGIETILIEQPEVQGAGKITSLIPLAVLFGELHYALKQFAPVITFTPSEWKHPISKEIYQHRLQQDHPTLWAQVAPQCQDSHSIDAVGLILYHVTGAKL